MSTFTKTNKSSAPSWTKTSRHSATWTKNTKTLGPNSFLLLENGSYLLLEDGVFKLILEQSNPSGPTWTKLTKS